MDRHKQGGLVLWASSAEFSVRLTRLDVCPWRAALSHGAQAFSFALLGGGLRQFAWAVLGTQPTPYFVLWILPAGLGLRSLVICRKADPGRSFPQLPRSCFATQSHTRTGFLSPPALALFKLSALHARLLACTAGGRPVMARFRRSGERRSVFCSLG